MAIYAAVHETGHALYEQGLPPELSDLPAGRHPSMGMHESQSRLWENQVGRSRPFTEFLLPHLKERYPEEIGLVAPDDFYRAVNHPKLGPIRVTADELTYNLHVAFRFEIERAVLRDELTVAELPDAWDDATERYLGITPDGGGDGVLQDMHWSIGALGYFPSYTLGNIYAGALWRKARDELGDLDDELRAGQTARLLEWLRTKIHSQGYRFEATELGERVLGAPVSSAPLLDYLRDKYAALYSVTI
jgi:carboxypeptidase Taq